jgi:hypothetical protein
MGSHRKEELPKVSLRMKAEIQSSKARALQNGLKIESMHRSERKGTGALIGGVGVILETTNQEAEIPLYRGHVIYD